MRFRPETSKPLLALVEVLLRGPHPLTPGERELIAAYVSGLNECDYCCSAHSAYAAAQLDEGMSLVDQVRANLDAAPISAKLRTLLGSPPRSARTAARSAPHWSKPPASKAPPTWKSTTPY